MKNSSNKTVKKKKFKPLKLVWDKEYQKFQESEVRKIKESFGKKIYNFEDYCDFLENFIYDLPQRKKSNSINKSFTLYPEKTKNNGEK